VSTLLPWIGTMSFSCLYQSAVVATLVRIEEGGFVRSRCAKGGLDHDPRASSRIFQIKREYGRGYRV
jgi:hypothetical protein